MGIFQHATLDVPNRAHGYCTDDVGRALIVACELALRAETSGDAARLVRTYLGYLQDAQLSDGWFHGFMGYDRRWQDDAGTPDAVGRAIWGLGYAEARAPRESWREVARRLRVRALPAIERMTYLRSRAYAGLGLAHALEGRPDDARAVRAALDACAEAIADAYDANATDDWRWCEDVITYDNARLPELLLRAAVLLDEPRYRARALEMLDFYAAEVVEDGVFVPVGNDGWYRRGGAKARFGQQPLEAAATVDAALAALDATGDDRWRTLAQTAFAWFSGDNTHGARMTAAGGCCDGIDPQGHNANMGAESTLAYLMSAIALAERTNVYRLLRPGRRSNA